MQRAAVAAVVVVEADHLHRLPAVGVVGDNIRSHHCPRPPVAVTASEEGVALEAGASHAPCPAPGTHPGTAAVEDHAAAVTA